MNNTAKFEINDGVPDYRYYYSAFKYSDKGKMANSFVKCSVHIFFLLLEIKFHLPSGNS